jgi:hypothetical protein
VRKKTRRLCLPPIHAFVGTEPFAIVASAWFECGMP